MVVKNKAPDMSGANDAAVSQAAIAREQWNDYKTLFAPVILDEMKRQGDVGARMADLAEEEQRFGIDRTRRFDDEYWNNVAPLSRQYIDEARAFNTEGKREELAGIAGADWQQSYDGALQQQQRGLQRMGVNPNSGAFAGMQNQMAMGNALGMAQSKNMARRQAEAIADDKMKSAIGIGTGNAGFANNSSQIAQGWGAQGMNTMGMQGALAGLGGLNQSAQGAGSNYAGAGNTFTGIAKVQQQAQASNPTNQLLGMGLSAGLNWAMPGASTMANKGAFSWGGKQNGLT
jgi:hypothetical protein